MGDMDPGRPEDASGFVPTVSEEYAEQIRLWHERAYRERRSEGKPEQTLDYLGLTIVVTAYLYAARHPGRSAAVLEDPAPPWPRARRVVARPEGPLPFDWDVTGSGLRPEQVSSKSCQTQPSPAVIRLPAPASPCSDCAGYGEFGGEPAYAAATAAAWAAVRLVCGRARNTGMSPSGASTGARPGNPAARYADPAA